MTSLPPNAPDSATSDSTAGDAAAPARAPRSPAKSGGTAARKPTASKSAAARSAASARTAAAKSAAVESHAAAAQAASAAENAAAVEVAAKAVKSARTTAGKAAAPTAGAGSKPAATRAPAKKAAPQGGTTGASSAAAKKTAAATKTAAAKKATATSKTTAAASTGAAKSAASKTAAAKKTTAAKSSAAASAGAKPAAARTRVKRAPVPPVEVAAETVDDGHLTVSEAPPKAAAPVAAPVEPAAEASALTPADVLVEAPVEAPVEVSAPAVATASAPAPATASTRRIAAVAPTGDAPFVLEISGLSKHFGEMKAVDAIDLAVRTGSFYGIVGPNGAGKTTTLSMVTGLLRPDAGSIQVHGVDVWADPEAAKRAIGVLPDRLRLFDRLTGAQLLYYSGILRGLDNAVVRERSADLAAAFGLEDALNRLVADYSAGMTKKIALACAMIHSPRLLVLDEPFEAVDPVSAANLTEILQKYVAAGGTVVLSSHGMDLIERVCDSVAIIVHGKVLASGTLDEVRETGSLEERFVELAGGRKAAEGMEWLHSFSD